MSTTSALHVSFSIILIFLIFVHSDLISYLSLIDELSICLLDYLSTSIHSISNLSFSIVHILCRVIHVAIT